jgi:hypothetical protein
VWSSRGEIVGAFTAGETSDTTPPAWSGVASGSLVTRWRGGMINGVFQLAPECGDDLVSLTAATSAHDDATKDEQLVYAIWAEPPTKLIDYTTPPRSFVAFDASMMMQGARGPMHLGFGNTEYMNDLDLPKARPLRVGVRVLDLAGNATPPSELTLK